MLKHSSFSRNKPQAVKADTWTTLYLTDGTTVTVAKNTEVYTVYLLATLQKVEPGSFVHLRVFEVESNSDGTGAKRVSTGRIIRRIATAGDNFIDGTWNGSLALPAPGRAHTVRIEIKIAGSSGIVAALDASADQWTE